MTYKVNGVPFVLQPTTGQWNPRRELGTDGENRTIYEPTYSFTMRWDATQQSDFDQIYEFWRSVSGTGQSSVEIPQKNAPDQYTFLSYDNCVLDEPRQAEYFEKGILKVELLIRSITI